MYSKNMLILALVLGIALVGKAQAQDPPPPGDQVRATSGKSFNIFIDEDGDGFNDLAPDQDGDGIPDRLDPDTKSARGGQGPLSGWIRFAKLFSLIMNQADMASSGPGGYGPDGESGLGQGPGQRTGFGPDSGDATGDGVDMGGRSQRRGGQR